MFRVKLTYQILLLFLLPGTQSAKLAAQNFFFYEDGFYEPAWALDLSGNIGFLNSITDVAGSKSGGSGIRAATLRSSQLFTGLTLTATHNDWIALRLDYGVGRIAGYDSTLADATHFSARGRYERNLSFRTPITEYSFGVEFHPLSIPKRFSDKPPPRLSPFVTVGIGQVRFNPQAEIDGNWVDLRPLRLEGQGFAEYPERRLYENTAMIIPFGVGLRYEVSRIFTLRMEVMSRRTNTDYLDDVSHGEWVDPSLFFNYLSVGQANLATRLYNRSVLVDPPRNTRPRGDNRNNDMYWSAQFKLGISLNRYRRY